MPLCSLFVYPFETKKHKHHYQPCCAFFQYLQLYKRYYSQLKLLKTLEKFFKTSESANTKSA